MIIDASFLAPLVQNALAHILIASIIGTPAGLAVAALMVPLSSPSGLVEQHSMPQRSRRTY